MTTTNWSGAQLSTYARFHWLYALGMEKLYSCMERAMLSRWSCQPNNYSWSHGIKRLMIWHVFFGTAGSINDITVLNASNVFNEVLSVRVPVVQYIVNGTQYDMGYYLANDIYPKFATFVKTISRPQGEKRKLFAQWHESTRKDEERNI